MEKAQQKIFDSDKRTLVIFDVDMVLIQPDEPAFQMVNINLHQKCIDRIVASLNRKQRALFFYLFLVRNGSVIVDKAVYSLLEKIQERNFSAMALTAFLTGSFMEIPLMEEVRLKTLRELELSFQGHAPFSDELLFKETVPFRGSHPVYSEGVLFTNSIDHNKGAIFANFLGKIEYQPERVVFIDDWLENVREMEHTLSHFYPKIEYEGIHFTGANDYPSKVLSEQEFETKWTEFFYEIKRIQ